MLSTPFWQRALRSLPAEVRPRYGREFEFAERVERMIEAVVDAWRSLRFKEARAPRQTPGAGRATRTG